MKNHLTGQKKLAINREIIYNNIVDEKTLRNSRRIQPFDFIGVAYLFLNVASTRFNEPKGFFIHEV
jgi:hypothetical protein